MSAPDTNPTQGFKATDQQLGAAWRADELYWRDAWQSRPYVRADRGFEYYRPAYRYGFESAHRYSGQPWDETEDQLRTSWDSYEHRGETSWHDIKEAVRDAWHRVTRR